MDAFDALGERAVTDAAAFWEESDEVRRWLACEQTADVKGEKIKDIQPDLEPPAWISAPAVKEVAQARLSPSRLAEEEEAASEQFAHSSAAHSPKEIDKYFRGRILHRLLELLPEIEPQKRPAAADRLLTRLARDIDDGERKRWREEVFSVLDNPAFAKAFGPGSRAEVGIAGEVGGAVITGQIDRLLVSDGVVQIIDYKTNRPPPKEVSDTAPAYLAQMAGYRALMEKIYPEHQVECALLWTFDARLMPLPKTLLDNAYERWVAPG